MLYGLVRLEDHASRLFSIEPSTAATVVGRIRNRPKGRPRGWYPPPDEVEPALRSCKLKLEFCKCFNYFLRITVQ